MKTIVPIVVAAVVLSAIVVGASYAYTAGKVSSAREDQIEALWLALGESRSASREEIEYLRLYTDELEEKFGVELSKEAELRLQAEANLKQELSDEVAAAKNSGVEAVARDWRSRIVQIKCVVDGSTKSGSGVLFQSTQFPGVLSAITSKHVIETDTATASSCTVSAKEAGVTFRMTPTAATAFTPDSDMDFAILRLGTDTALASIMTSPLRVCSRKANIGEEIVILGYPSIGSQEDITVTEGIVSGYDDEFYITSAKVERGNSGGAAILVEESCYAGLPSFTYAGSVESLARVLSAQEMEL